MSLIAGVALAFQALVPMARRLPMERGHELEVQAAAEALARLIGRVEALERRVDGLSLAVERARGDLERAEEAIRELRLNAIHPLGLAPMRRGHSLEQPAMQQQQAMMYQQMVMNQAQQAQLGQYAGMLSQAAYPVGELIDCSPSRQRFLSPSKVGPWP